jgi:hypothetical protein
VLEGPDPILRLGTQVLTGWATRRAIGNITTRALRARAGRKWRIALTATNRRSTIGRRLATPAKQFIDAKTTAKNASGNGSPLGCLLPTGLGINVNLFGWGWESLWSGLGWGVGLLDLKLGVDWFVVEVEPLGVGELNLVSFKWTGRCCQIVGVEVGHTGGLRGHDHPSLGIIRPHGVHARH